MNELERIIRNMSYSADVKLEALEEEQRSQDGGGLLSTGWTPMSRDKVENMRDRDWVRWRQTVFESLD